MMTDPRSGARGAGVPMGLFFSPALPSSGELEAVCETDEMLAREKRSGLGRAAVASRPS